MSYCPSVHVLTSIASVANALYIIKLPYNSTVSMVMDAICNIAVIPSTSTFAVFCKHLPSPLATALTYVSYFYGLGAVHAPVRNKYRDYHMHRILICNRVRKS